MDLSGPDASTSDDAAGKKTKTKRETTFCRLFDARGATKPKTFATITHLCAGAGGCGFAHEAQERAVARASRDEPVARRRGALLLYALEPVEGRALQVRELHELDELGGGVVRQRARHRSFDVVDVYFEPPYEVLQALSGGGGREVPGDESEEPLENAVQFVVERLVLQLAVRLGRAAREQRLLVRLEAAVQPTQLGETCGEVGAFAKRATRAIVSFCRFFLVSVRVERRFARTETRRTTREASGRRAGGAPGGRSRDAARTRACHGASSARRRDRTRLSPRRRGGAVAGERASEGCVGGRKAAAAGAPRPRAGVGTHLARPRRISSPGLCQPPREARKATTPCPSASPPSEPPRRQPAAARRETSWRPPRAFGIARSALGSLTRRVSRPHALSRTVGPRDGRPPVRRVRVERAPRVWRAAGERTRTSRAHRPTKEESRRRCFSWLVFGPCRVSRAP